MKTIIFSLIATCFLFAACSDNDGLIPVVNDEPETIAGEEQELVPVSFNLDFTKEEVPFRSSESSAFTLKYLEYFVFDNNWQLYKSNKLVDSDGSIDEEFSTGNYTIIFVGYNDGTMSITNNNRFINDPATYHLSVADGDALTDQFYKRIECLIKYDQVNNIAVTLERNVGKVEIVLDEMIPDEVTNITIGEFSKFNTFCFSRFNNNFSGGLLTVISPEQNIEISAEDRLSKGFTISFLFYEPAPNFTSPSHPVPFEIKSIYGGKTVSKTIPLNEIQNNKTKRYKGRLFEATDTPFALSIDDSWDGEPIEKPF